MTAGNVVTCTECEANFLLVNDMTTGSLIQSCQRSSIYCPSFCVCDFGGTMNCTQCNQTGYGLVKELGISNFSQCVPTASIATWGASCGPNCLNCNTALGICLVCKSGYAIQYDSTTTLTASKFFCDLPCGQGCLNCNLATRSCLQCDTANNYTSYTRWNNPTTLRCQLLTYMCDAACINCNTNGLRLYPPVLTGQCTQCAKGFYVTGTSNCRVCPNLCSGCNDISGSCTSCQSITNTLYFDVARNVNLCTALTCQSSCLTCDIPGGMNGAYSRPNCYKCV